MPDKEPDYKIVKCWCCPPNMMCVIPDPNPCEWPKCINGDRGDPNGGG